MIFRATTILCTWFAVIYAFTGVLSAQTPRPAINDEVRGGPALKPLDDGTSSKKSFKISELPLYTFKETVSGLKIHDLETGSGSEVVNGDRLTVHYKLWLRDSGKPVDSSYGKAGPFTFKVGAGKVIRGWNEGVIGMKKGGTRILVVPPHLGYGKKKAPAHIGPNATLVFEITLLTIE